jgi:hypothetical protein
MFGLGSTFGISMGTLLLTAAFRYYSGDALATPTPANPGVRQRDEFYLLVAGIMGLMAMACSAMRGKKKGGDAHLGSTGPRERSRGIFRMLIQMLRLRDIHGNHFDVGEFLLDGVGDPCAPRL